MRTMETSSHSENSTLRKVPTLSLASYTQGTDADRAKFIDSLFTGLKEYGFIILKDHNVKAESLHKAYELLKKFYALPTEVKKSYISPKAGFQRGYTPFGQEHAKDSPVMDLKEFWHVGRVLSEGNALKSVYPENVWP
ncbi:MAG TPA: 2-oxoglutarate and iron-dependent oxygenase domain-containing protein, partial [Bdellovibrio sp.]